MHYKGTPVGNFLFFTQETGTYFLQHRNIFELLLLPIMALSAWVIISRPKFNYIETLVMGIYIFSVLQLFLTLQIIISGLLLKINFMTSRFEIQTLIINLGWVIYCLMDVFRSEKIKLLFLRILLSIVITVFVYYFLGGLIVNIILGITNQRH